MKIKRKHQEPFQGDHHYQWLRSSLVGYPFAVIFAAAAFLIPMFERSVGIQDLFVEPPFVIAVLLVGWFWGVGPALLALLLQLFAIDYWVVPPFGVIDFFRWPEIVSFAPFILIQLIVLGMVVIQKRYRQRLLHANQVMSQQAQALAESNVQLQQADQVKDQFLSMASHELRTPVTRIQGTIQLLQRRLKRQNIQLPVNDSLDEVDRSIQQLTDLINDLLNINTLRSGKLPVHLVPCDLRLLCEHIIEEQQKQTERSIDLHLPADLVIVRVDSIRFSQVVSNLISNALKYSSAETPIRVEISERSGEAILEVHNVGPAIPKEQQEMLFEPFYRSPEAHISEVSGWGLGLAICKEIVVRHGGRIWVESEEEDGTTFFVALPLSVGPLSSSISF